MNRITLVSLVTAAVLGSAGGVAYAVGAGDDAPREHRAADPADPAASTPTTPTTEPTSTPAGPFYFLHGTIHDGDAEVAVPGVDADLVLSLERARDGYLVVYYGDHEDQQTGVYVTPGGATWKVGPLVGPWHVDPAGERVAYGDGRGGWQVAVLADRTTHPLGAADPWTPRQLGEPGGEPRYVSDDGRYAVESRPNPATGPATPVGGCLTGGALADTGSWWAECSTGTASRAPYSPSGTLLLTETAVGDGPPPSALQVRDPATGRVTGRIDPGGYRSGAAWGADDTIVYTVTGRDDTDKIALSRCVVATGDCTTQVEAEGNLVLGSG
ncbi:hypothetical protein ACIRN4_02870 [Pimelobacter simplex]|uniref:hypothetical protein n=1 Tax=Nocardioides simplex TaxID=2045 RepID=UPI00381B5B97